MLNYSELKKEDLFSLLAEKDREAIKFVYDKYAPAIYGLILGRVRDSNDANEILFKTFVSCVKNISKNSSTTKGIFISLRNIATLYINNRYKMQVVPPTQIKPAAFRGA